MKGIIIRRSQKNALICVLADERDLVFREPTPEELEDRFLLPYEKLTDDEKIMWGMPETVAWRFVAETLTAARLRLRLSKRQAARRAGISEGTWRQLEKGPEFMNGVLYTNNTRPENLFAAARAVGVEPKVIFDAFAQEVPAGVDFTPYDDRLAKKISRLEVRDRDLVERLVDSMMDNSVGDELEIDDV
jgi:transcriptional regulator with XRE-family HTH domain